MNVGMGPQEMLCKNVGSVLSRWTEHCVRLGPEFWAFYFFLFTCLVHFCFLGFCLGVTFKMFLTGVTPLKEVITVGKQGAGRF